MELPLASPLLMTGVRTAAVQVVATATLAALVAGGGLGRIITLGFRQQDYGAVLAGAILVAALAVLTELVLAALSWALTPGPAPAAATCRPVRRPVRPTRHWRPRPSEQVTKAQRTPTMDCGQPVGGVALPPRDLSRQTRVAAGLPRDTEGGAVAPCAHALGSSLLSPSRSR